MQPVVLELDLVRVCHRHGGDAIFGQDWKGGARHSSRREHVLPHVLVVVLPGDDLDDTAQKHEAGVAVGPLRPRLELGPFSPGDVDEGLDGRMRSSES